MHNSCASATVIASLPYSAAGVDNSAATEDVGDPTFSIDSDGYIANGTTVFKTMFAKYTPPSNQTVRFTCSNSDVAIGVFTGSCGALTEIVSWVDALTIALTAGVTYTFAVGSFANAGEVFDISIAVSTAPPNQTQHTARTISTLPFSETVNLADADDNGTLSLQPKVYYKYTAQDGDTVIGFWAYGGASFSVLSVPFIGPSNSYDDNDILLGMSSQTDRPMQFPVTPGTTYIIRVIAAGGTHGPVDISVLRAPNDAAPTGSIVIPDDTNGFPAAIVDPSTGEVIRFINPFPAGEQGDVLDDGTILVEDAFQSPDVVKLYSPALVLLVTLDPFPAVNTSQHFIRISPGLQLFYVGTARTGGAQITTVDGDGVQGGTTWTLPVNGMTGIAPNNDGSIVYVSGQGASINTPVKRWQTGSSSMGSDLIAGQGANTVAFDMLVLEDDTVIVGWLNTVTDVVTVKHLEDDGTLLGTFTGSSDAATVPKLAYDPDSRQSHFWVWTHASNVSRFSKIRVSDMSEVAFTLTREYEGGAYQGAETATPDQRFGISFSCPFFFLRAALGASIGGGVIGPLAWVHFPRRVP